MTIRLEFPWGIAERENNRQTIRLGRRLTNRKGEPKDGKCAQVLDLARELGILGEGEHIEIFGDKTPRIATTGAYRNAKDALADLAAAQIDGTLERVFEGGDRLRIVGRLYPQKGQRPDATAYAKIIADALEGVVYTNDYWLVDQRWERLETNPQPRIEVEIEPIPEGGQTKLEL